MSLFPDDILLFWENPITTILAMLQSLNDYSTVSGYKVNTNKSQALMIVENWPSQLDDLVPFRHSIQGFKYLGVTITPTTIHLVSSNHESYLGKSELI